MYGFASYRTINRRSLSQQPFIYSIFCHCYHVANWSFIVFPHNSSNYNKKNADRQPIILCNKNMKDFVWKIRWMIPHNNSARVYSMCIQLSTKMEIRSRMAFAPFCFPYVWDYTIITVTLFLLLWSLFVLHHVINAILLVRCAVISCDTMDASVRNRIIATTIAGAALTGLAAGTLAWYALSYLCTTSDSSDWWVWLIGSLMAIGSWPRNGSQIMVHMINQHGVVLHWLN